MLLAATGHQSSLISGASGLMDIVSFLFLAAGVVAAILAFRTKLSAADIANYQAAAKSVETAYRGQQIENRELKRLVEELQAAREKDQEKMRDLQAKLTALQDIVTGKTALEELAGQVARNFAELRAAMASMSAMEQYYRDLKSGQDAIKSCQDAILSRLSGRTAHGS